MAAGEIALIRALFDRQIVGQTVAWQAHTLFITARRPKESTSG